jgi:putative hydroxymethylpyrimidine transport system substrate-binding protein
MHRASLLLAVLLITACGSSATSSPPKAPPVSIALDFTPNAVHAPLYMAGGALTIRKPGAGPDSLKLVSSGKVDLGVLDIHDLAIAREQGTDLVAVGVLVDKPLAALIAQPGVARPRDLEGRTVGVSGLPSDPAFLKAIVTDDGGDYAKIKQVTIGFNAVSRLLTKRVDAVPAFWNAEGVVLKARGLKTNEFRVEDYGAPPYPEVVIVTARKTLNAKRKQLAAALDAIRTGVRLTHEQPDAAAAKIAKAAETSDTGLIRAQLDAVSPLFPDDLKVDRGLLDQWATFEARIGLVKAKPDVRATFDFGL